VYGYVYGTVQYQTSRADNGHVWGDCRYSHAGEKFVGVVAVFGSCCIGDAVLTVTLQQLALRENLFFWGGFFGVGRMSETRQGGTCSTLTARPGRSQRSAFGGLRLNH
jgi:hypothetical protein